MKNNIKVEMLCQQDGAKVYFEEYVPDYMAAQTAIIEMCEKLNEYDPIHGYTFDVYINRCYRGYYEKDCKVVHLDKAFKIMLVVDMMMKGLITEDELVGLLKTK